MFPQSFKFFTFKEALRFCTPEEIVECVNRGYISNLFYMLYHLDGVRRVYGRPVVITSSFRNYGHNKVVGGSPTSQHMTASAVDVRPSKSGKSDLRLLASAIQIYNDNYHVFGQVIIYNTFIHIGAKDPNVESCSYFHIIDENGLLKSDTNL